MDPIFSVGGIKVHPDQLGALIREALGGHPPKFRHQVVSEEGLEILDIELTVEEAFFSDEIKALEGLCRRARRHLQDHLGINARITLKELGTAGKMCNGHETYGASPEGRVLNPPLSQVILSGSIHDAGSWFSVPVEVCTHF